MSSLKWVLQDNSNIVRVQESVDLFFVEKDDEEFHVLKDRKRLFNGELKISLGEVAEAFKDQENSVGVLSLENDLITNKHL